MFYKFIFFDTMDIIDIIVTIVIINKIVTIETRVPEKNIT